MRIATDVGGTFTDLVYLDIDENGKVLGIKTSKSDTTPPNFEEGVFNTLNDAKIDISSKTYIFIKFRQCLINCNYDLAGNRQDLLNAGPIIHEVSDWPHDMKF